MMHKKEIKMAGNEERLKRNKGKKNTVLKVQNLKHKISMKFIKPIRKEKENG